MDYTQLTAILDSYTSVLLGKYPHRYLCYDLTAPYNAALALMLLEDGYWDYAPHRSSRLVGAHQIIAFYCTAHPAHGGDAVEVHHINGNTTDNRPSNLMYLSPGDHALVTKYQRHMGRLSLKVFSKVGKGMLHTAFNRRGRPIKNWVRFIMTVIALTVSNTQRWVQSFCDMATQIAMIPIKGVVANIQRILRGLAPQQAGPIHTTT
jgi:hypothetical protein